MTNAFVEKLRGYRPFSTADAALLNLACENQRYVSARSNLIHEGDKPGPVFVLLEGWACRYTILPEGGRQITALLMPGDSCDAHAALLNEIDHSIGALTKCRVASIPSELVETLIATRPAIALAFWWNELVQSATQRAWIVSMGRRDSLQRVAHLMCEIYARMLGVGLATTNSCQLPLTQTVLADALGLTPIHINRVLRKLREDGLMDLAAKTLTISDAVGLAKVAGFDDIYLHRRLNEAENVRRQAQ